MTTSMVSPPSPHSSSCNSMNSAIGGLSHKTWESNSNSMLCTVMYIRLSTVTENSLLAEQQLLAYVHYLSIEQ